MRSQKILGGVLFVTFFILAGQGILAFSERGLLVCNSGGAFGLAVSPILLICLTTVTLILFGVQWWREECLKSRFFWMLLLAGGASNLLERILYGCVTDYFTLPYIPTFNLADVLLTIGALGVVWFHWKREERMPKDK